MVEIPKTILDGMLSHALDDYPNECCGLLAGPKGRVTRLYRMTNTDHSPVRYLMDPKEQFAVFKEMRAEGTDLAAIYHSHPHTQAYPSPTDVELAYYPEALYIVISLENRDKPAVRAFRITEGRITPEEFKSG